MSTIPCGLFEYSDLLNATQIAALPEVLRLDALNEEGLLIRVLTGNIKIERTNKLSHVVILRKNYMTLPTDRPSYDTKRILKSALDLDLDDPLKVDKFKAYLGNNIKNHEIYKNILNEITQYFFYEVNAPTTAFLHLYRCLEWISYCAPLIYASLTKDFKKSYNSLKSFFTDDKAGQISFFTTFLNTIIQGDAVLQRFDFEYCPVGSERMQIERDFKRIAKEANVNVEFIGGKCKIKFVNVVKIFKVVRDRYFHFAIGSEKENIAAVDYNIEDFVRPLNRLLINWISVVFSLIVMRGYTL